MNEPAVMSKKETPLVSFVTPSYNTLEYLKETIRSIHDQGYPNLQHIVMDGGSTDGTVEYASSLPYITFISEKDRGQSHAINKALALCEGEIIGWLNSDDTSNPGAIDFVVQFFLEHPEVDYLHSDVNILDKNGAVVGRSIGEELNLDKIVRINPVKQPSLFMRKRVLETLGLLREDLHYVMDREFWLRFCIRGLKGQYIEGKTLANFRLMAGTKTSESGPKFLNEWIGVLEEYKQNGIFPEQELPMVQRAVNKTRGAWHIEKMRSRRETKDLLAVTRHFIHALKYDPSMWKNRGAWAFFVVRLFGVELNRDNRFRKHMQNQGSSKA